jgi:hypothetical protein
MSCDALREAIVEVGRGQRVGRGTAAAVDTHVAHCRPCAARLERERELSAGLRALASESSHSTASDDLERSLVEAFRKRQSPAIRTGIKAWVPIAAAAVVLVGAGLWLSRSGGENPAGATPEPVRAVQSATPPPVADASEPTIVPSDRKADPVVTTRRQNRSLRQRPSRFVAAEGFVMLPAALNLPAFESGEIVRMELPVTALPAYGLEIAPEARRSAVEADLLVGQDGQARAIRLVNSVRLQPNQ